MKFTTVLAYLVDPQACLDRCDQHASSGNPVVQKMAFANFVQQKIEHYMKKRSIDSASAKETLVAASAYLQALQLRVQVDHKKQVNQNVAVCAPAVPQVQIQVQENSPKRRL